MRALILAVGVLVVAILVTGATPAAAVGSCEEDWPTLARDDHRTNSCGPAVGPGTGELLWTFKARGSGIASTPAVVDGVVYFGSDGGDLYAVDATNGSLIWQVPGVTSGVTSPAVVDGRVIIGGGDTGNVTAVEADTGEVLWRHQTGSQRVMASVTVDDGTVYIGTGSNTLHALAAEDGRERWAATPGSGDRDEMWTPPIVAEGLVIVGSTDNHLYAFSQDTGEMVWSFETGTGTSDRVVGAPVVDGGRVIAATHRGEVFALNLGSGELDWSAETPSPTQGQLTVSEGYLYLGSVASKIVALEVETGAEAWTETFRRGEGFLGGLAVSGGTLYANGADGGMYALDAGTGERLWHNREAGGGAGSPTVADGVLYVGSDGYSASLLYALDVGAGLAPGEGGRYEGEPVTGQQDPIPGGWVGGLLATLTVAAFLQRTKRRF